ncbi:MAG: hypothetical protein KGJ13_06265 [Patescibacteria group bacterium]|nr:hypothetical protein [Patescibacteria group bacterium]
MPKIINMKIIAHPMNWVTVVLMTIIGLIALNLILTPWHIPTKTSDQLNANSVPGPYLATSQ